MIGTSTIAIGNLQRGAYYERDVKIGKLCGHVRAVGRNWGSGGFPPVKLFEITPTRALVNVIFQNETEMAFIIEFYMIRVKLTLQPSFIHF